VKFNAAVAPIVIFRFEAIYLECIRYQVIFLHTKIKVPILNVPRRSHTPISQYSRWRRPPFWEKRSTSQTVPRDACRALLLAVKFHVVAATILSRLLKPYL